MKRIFLDTETTGFSPGQIGQLSMIIDEDGNEPVAKNYFFEIDYISADAEKVCGRGVDFYKEVSGGKRFADYATEISEILKTGTWIAHNLKFDENFISTEFWRQNIILKPENRFCTMEYFRDICKLPAKSGKTKYKNPKLEEFVDCMQVNKNKVMKYCSILFGDDNLGGFHDARYDTTSMFVAFKMYNDMLQGTSSWVSTFRKQV